MLPHLAARLFGTPLLIHQPKLEVILSVLGPRLGLPERAGQGGYARSERPVSESPSGIAVIPIHGSLVRRTSGLEADSGLTSYQSVQQMLEMARDDSAVDALLLDIDSPGGESSGVFDLADKIRTIGLQKPVWAVANDMAFSAAYALASAAQKVYVSRTGGVGSIGVIAMHVDQSVKDAQDGLHYTAVYAGSRKNDLSPHGPMTTEAQRFLQGEVDRVYGLFVDTVARYRNLSSKVIRDTEAGLFFGKDAVRAGLADAVGTLDDALLALTESLAPTLSVPTRGNTMARPPKPTLDMTANTDPAPDSEELGGADVTLLGSAARFGLCNPAGNGRPPESKLPGNGLLRASSFMHPQRRFAQLLARRRLQFSGVNSLNFHGQILTHPYLIIWPG